jgi:hypothetical protein
METVTCQKSLKISDLGAFVVGTWKVEGEYLHNTRIITGNGKPGEIFDFGSDMRCIALIIGFGRRSEISWLLPK